MPMPVDHAPLGIDDIEVLFPRLAAIDGHPRNAGDDCDVWLAAARQGRWTRAQIAAATLALAAGFTGYRIMPGHVGEQIAEQSRRIRDRWYCPDPPRELADNPAAELAWRRRAAADHRDRALLALAAGRDLDEVPLTLSPEQATSEISAPGRVQAICAELAQHRSVDGGAV